MRIVTKERRANEICVTMTSVFLSRVRSRFSFARFETGQFLQELALAHRQVRRCFDLRHHVKIAFGGAVKLRHAFAAQPQGRAALRAWRYRDLEYFSMQTGKVDFCAESGAGKADGSGEVKIVSIAL